MHYTTVQSPLILGTSFLLVNKRIGCGVNIVPWLSADQVDTKGGALLDLAALYERTGDFRRLW